MAWIQLCLIACLLPWIVQLFDDSAKDVCIEKNRFYCNISTKCIDKSSVCDGYIHCKEGEDESPPGCSKDVCIETNRFYCNISRRCIPTRSVCDGSTYCKEGEDESPPACSMDKCLQAGNFYCNISGRCISKYSVCDGFTDCKEHDDESPPACTMDKCRQAFYFYCNISERCIRQSSVCDGITNCKEREDESPPACSVDECFRRNRTVCVGSLCIPTSSLSDGTADCPGGEDEGYVAYSLKDQCESNRSLSRGCLGECTPGAFGKYCSQECGKGCLMINSFPQCDKQSGKCMNGCKIYYYGNYCNNTCKNCKLNLYSSPCDINGVCQFGCENDYWDKNCSSKCSANCQGDEHGKRCNSSTGECINGCTRGWSGKLCGDSTDKENVSSLNTTVIVIPVIAAVVVVIVGIICYFWGRKRFNRQQNERIEPRREFRVGVAPRQRPSGSRRRQSSTLYADINEETMEHYHYICEQNPPDHYDKIKDRKPCICPQCVRERVDPILQRISSGSSSTTFVEPYATCGWSVWSRSSSDSYISNSKLNTRRNVPTNDSDSGIVPTKELSDNRKPGLSTSHSAGDLAHVCKTDYTNGVNPRPCVAKSKSCIELVCTHEYLDLEELYQTAKAEDRRKLAAKYFDEGEDVFGVIGQFQAKDILDTEKEETEVLNQLDNQNLGQNIESSLVIGRLEQIEESCCANDIDFIVEQQPAQSQNDAKMDDPKDTDGMGDIDEIKQTDSLV